MSGKSNSTPPVPPTAAPAPLELARLIERMHRRFLDVLRLELGRLRIEDISPVQAMMMANIGSNDISVRDLIERGHYLGSNASYNLKNLVENGYVDRTPSARDKRSARLKLSAKGLKLYEEIRRLEAGLSNALLQSPADQQDFSTTQKILRKLERQWTDAIRYSPDEDADW
jgi:DNA-binding MarR family transcriptional regulator